MTGAAYPYGDLKDLIAGLTHDAGDLARAAKAEAMAAKTPEARRAAEAAFERMFRAVRMGAAWLARLDEAAVKLDKALRETRTQAESQARSGRLRHRREHLAAVLDPLPFDERLPHLNRFEKLAGNLAIPDEVFLAQVDELAATIAAEKTRQAETATRSQSEIMAAAMAMKRSRPALQRSG